MKKGQVTIYIIITIIIVAAILLILFLRKNAGPDIPVGPEAIPESILDTCIKDKVKEGIRLIGDNGGDIDPDNFISYKLSEQQFAHKFSYLCYYEGFNLPCIPQQPALISHVQEELKEFITGEVENCFDNLTLTLSEQGNIVDAQYNGFILNLSKNFVNLKIFGELVLTKSGETSRHENFEIKIPSKIYGLTRAANEIADQEARFCNFNTLGYMLIYPELKMGPPTIAHEGSKIYIVQNRQTKEEFRFAVRGCVLAEGN